MAGLELESHSPFPALLQGAGAAGCPQGPGCRWGDSHSPHLSGCTSAVRPRDAIARFGAVAVTIRALFQRAAYSHPSPPMAFFISFWLGIRHVLTEQTFCCPQNPLLRRGVMFSLCRCPEPALGWGQQGLGPGQHRKGKSGAVLRSRPTPGLEPGSGSLLSCRALIAFCFNILSCETRDATEECCPSLKGLWRVLVAQVCRELCVSPACLPYRSQFCSPQARLQEPRRLLVGPGRLATPRMPANCPMEVKFAGEKRIPPSFKASPAPGEGVQARHAAAIPCPQAPDLS